MGNSKIFKTVPFYNPRKNISFGGEEEEQMIQKFNAFDILWYAPKDSEKLEEWIAFTNIDIIKISEEEKFMTLVLEGIFFNRIIITTGSFAKKIISKIEKITLAKIIIYCMNLEYHKKWSEKYDSIVGVFTHPSQIFQYLLKYQESAFGIPIFSYKMNSNKEFNFNYYNSKTNEEILVNKNIFSLKFNSYEKFCLLIFNELKLARTNNKFYKKFISNSKNILGIFYENIIDDIPGNIKFLSFFPKLNNQLKELLIFIMGLTIVSLYFSKFPFLYGVLEYEEVEKIILKEKYTINDLRKDYKELNDSNIIIILSNKLMEEKTSILEETTNLKMLHLFLINFNLLLIYEKYEFNEYLNFPLMIKYLMDLDFCLKLFICQFYELYNKINFEICYRTLYEVDKRIPIFFVYCKLNKDKEFALKEISQQNFNILNETLRIRDFIVIGEEIFFEKIRNIENLFKHRKNIPYLSISQVRDYLKKKKEEKYRNFFYFIITSSEEASKSFKELYEIRDKFGLILSIIIYINDKTSLINKIPFQGKEHMPIFIANNTNEIINYINGQEDLNCGHNFLNQSADLTEEKTELLNIFNSMKFPKIEKKNEDKNDLISCEDGWELVNTLPEKIFKNDFLENIGNTILIDDIGLYFFKMYRQYKIEYLFYSTYCNYFYFHILPEFFFNPISIELKHFLYAYTLDEGKNSFYYILNRELRHPETSKIAKLIPLISMLNEEIKIQRKKGYCIKFFRATKMQNELIEQKLIEGKNTTNMCFWSATKERKIAENFLADSFRNILFVINSKKNYIDLEEISKYKNEKEVLFLPFTEFLVKSKKIIIFKRKKVYEVQLEELDEQRKRENIQPKPIANELIKSLQNEYTI